MSLSQPRYREQSERHFLVRRIDGWNRIALIHWKAIFIPFPQSLEGKLGRNRQGQAKKSEMTRKAGLRAGMPLKSTRGDQPAAIKLL